jgi:hypothetical protein
LGVVAASASHGVVVSRRRRKLQEFGQCGRASAVHGRTHGRLDRFQIQPACLAPTGENSPQQLVYFARDLLADRFRRFFSWSVDGSPLVGRKRQISAFVSTNSRLSCWNLRNSATSRSTLWMAAGVGSDSETLLPPTL